MQQCSAKSCKSLRGTWKLEPGSADSCKSLLRDLEARVQLIPEAYSRVTGKPPLSLNNPAFLAAQGLFGI
ncbi:hypothetical protein B9D94_09205 [Paenibacillus sp. Cedars]|nr:hypothetical protein B9D94_09205 [Paenibacillus sp. Cedars]